MDTGDTFQKIFQLKDPEEYPPYNDKFDFLGYSTSNFIYNIGTPLYMVMLFLLYLFVYLIIWKIEFKRSLLVKIKDTLKEKIFFGPPMRFIIETVMEGTISSIVNIVPLIQDRSIS